MGKKKAIKLTTAAAIAASAFVAVAPTQSEAATNSVDKAITKATNQMAKAYDTYHKPAKNEGKLPATGTIRNQVKLANDYYAAATKEIAKNGGSKTKKAAYTKKLEAKKNLLDRAEAYLAAVNTNLNPAKTAFNEAVAGGKQKTVLVEQKAYNKAIKGFEAKVDKIYGPDARNLLKSKYAAPAHKIADSVNDEMKVYQAYKQVEDDNLIVKDLEKAGKVIDSVKVEVVKLKTKDSKLALNVMKAVEKNNKAYEEAQVPKVEEVTAINGKIIEVKFNKAIDVKTLKNTDSNDVITLVANEGASNAGTISQELSKDGKTLTLKASATFKGDYTVKVPFEIVKDVAGKYVSPVNQKVVVNDESAPSVTSAVSSIKDVKDGIKKITLTFDEEVTTIDTVKINGVNYTAAVNGNKATVVVDLDATKSYDITVVNATDASNNIKDVQVIPLSVSIDNVAPSVVNVKATGENTVKVTLDKELQDDTLPISGKVGTFTANVVKSVKVNPLNKKEYTVELNKEYLFKNGISDTVNFTVEKESLVDTLGNKNTEEINKTAVVLKDAKAPSVEKVEPITTGGEVTGFAVTYNEEIVNPTSSKLSVVNSKGEIFTPSTIIKNTVVSTNDSKTVIFTLAEDVVANKYSFDLSEGFVQDKALTPNNSSKYNFTIDVKKSEKPAETSFTIKEVSSSDNVITVDYNTKVKATGTGSALDASAYQVNGTSLPSDTKIEFAKDSNGNVNQTKVLITLSDGFVKASDDKAVFRITAVQTLDNKVSAPFTKTIEITDNVVPEAKTITATDLNKLTVTYSEAIVLAKDADITDEIVLTDSKGNKVTYTEAVVIDGKLVLTVEGASGVSKLTTLKVADVKNADIQDTAKNIQKAGLIINK